MWLVVLSDQLPVIALVSHYLANKLIGRGLIVQRQALRSPALISQYHPELARLSTGYAELHGKFPRVTHPYATLAIRYCYPLASVRLACLIHAASVRSEPESNSPFKETTAVFYLATSRLLARAFLSRTIELSMNSRHLSFRERHP